MYDKLKVKSLERHGKRVEQVSGGDRAAINISGLKYEDFDRGMLLAGAPLDGVTMLDAIVELFPGKTRLRVWSHQIFHTGTFTAKARVHLITKNELHGGENAVAQIHLEKPAILLANDRFILRNTSNDITFGGGMILDPNPLHHRRRTEKLKTGMENLARIMTDRENLAELIRFELEKANAPVSLEQLSSGMTKPEEELQAVITEASGLASVYSFEGKIFLADKKFEIRISNAIGEILQTWHQQNPLNERGLEAHELAGKLKLESKGFELYFLNQILDKLLHAGKLKMAGTSYTLKDHTITFDRKAEEQMKRVEEIIINFGMQRTSIKELEAVVQEKQIRKGQLASLLQHLAAKKKIYLIGGDVLHASIVDKARNDLLRKLSVSPRGINEKEFRFLIDGTKNGVQLLITLFLREGTISKQTFYLHITEKGKGMV
jgi:selenocysteine-specific elongation factor